MSNMRRQDQRVPLRDILVRVVQGFLQAHRAEQEELHVSAGRELSGHRGHEEEVSCLSV